MILRNHDVLKSSYDKTMTADTANTMRLFMQDSRETTGFLRGDQASTIGERSKTEESVSSNPSGSMHLSYSQAIQE